MNKYLVKAGTFLIVFGLGFAVCKYAMPAKTITIEKEVVVEKRDVTTKTVRTKNPDGSSTTTRVTEDKTVIDSEKNKKSVVINEKPNYNVAAGIGYDFQNKKEVYSVQVQKRFAGPVFLGALGTFGTDQGQGLITLGLEF